MRIETPPPTDILDPLLSDKQLAEAEGCSEETIRRERKLGRRPPIVRVSPRRFGTRASVYRKWQLENERQK
jgi:hypothetical protein